MLLKGMLAGSEQRVKGKTPDPYLIRPQRRTRSRRGILRRLLVPIRFFSSIEQDKREQVFRVIDGALENHDGYASIYVSFPEKRGVYERKMRKLLLPFL